MKKGLVVFVMCLLSLACSDHESVVHDRSSTRSIQNVSLSSVSSCNSELDPNIQVCDLDLDGSGSVTAVDVVYLRRKILNPSGNTLENKTYDINGDGSVTAKDVLLFQKYILGLVDENAFVTCDCLKHLPSTHPRACRFDDHQARSYKDNGSGTSTDPYRIYTALALASLASEKELVHVYQLCQNIDLNSFYSNDHDYFFIQSQFKGEFDGNGFTIDGFTLKNQNNGAHEGMGLFKSLEEHALVHDLTLSNVSINLSENTQPVGGLVGVLKNNARIENVSVQGNIQSDHATGGIVGQMQSGEILQVKSQVRLNSKANAGLAVGEIALDALNLGSPFAILQNIQTSGEIEHALHAGGVVGVIENNQSLGAVLLENSQSDAHIQSALNCVGGLVGKATGQTTQILRSQFKGRVDVLNLSCVGGLVGELDEAYLFESINEGHITGQDMVGGAIGHMNNGLVVKTKNRGIVSGANQTGGFVGLVKGGKIEFSSSSTMVSGLKASGGFVGELQGGSIRYSHSDGSVQGNVMPSEHMGGFAGLVQGGMIEWSYSNANVSSNHVGTGGLIGSIIADQNVDIMNSYALTNTIQSSQNNTGGLIGLVSGLNPVNIENTYSWVDLMNGQDHVGSWLGLEDQNNLTVKNSFTLVRQMRGQKHVGSVVGKPFGFALSQIYYTSTYVCQSDCNQLGILVSNHHDFYQPTNPPLNQWTFEPQAWSVDGQNPPFIAWAR